MDAEQTGRLPELLWNMVESASSDLHLVPGYPATYRTHGVLSAAADGPLDDAGVRVMLDELPAEAIRSRDSAKKDLDCSLTLHRDGATCRFRVNVFYSRGETCACFRHIPNDVPSFEWMGFPQELAERVVGLRNGLVIATGVTGSGKTTTLAGLVNLIAQQGSKRIITIEHPIEYLFPRTGSSVITQREIGVDVDSFYDGLVHGLRQDPDVVLVGEIRDAETARVALSAAETGHLILATLHTQDAKGAITRLVDLFPHDAQDDVRSQLSLSLRYVLCQHLLPAATAGEKRALALEVLNVTHPVKAAIRFGKIESIESAIQTGRKDGMVSLDENLAELVTSGRISWETAKHFAKDAQAVADYAGTTDNR